MEVFLRFVRGSQVPFPQDHVDKRVARAHHRCPVTSRSTQTRRGRSTNSRATNASTHQRRKCVVGLRPRVFQMPCLACVWFVTEWAGMSSQSSWQFKRSDRRNPMLPNARNDRPMFGEAGIYNERRIVSTEACGIRLGRLSLSLLSPVTNSQRSIPSSHPTASGVLLWGG